MARYLLDTTVLIDHLRGQPKAVELMTRMARLGHELGVCCINIAELYSGLANEEQVRADKLINSLAYYEISRDTAKLAGGYRFRFARKGVALTTTDTLVAAAAVSNEATLVTANVRDYPIEEVELLQQP